MDQINENRIRQRVDRPDRKLSTSLLVLSIFAIGLFASDAFADVRAQISSQEAYVGSPVTLYVQVSGAKTSAAPELSPVDGLSIRRSGAPRRNSQVTIINGRRSESSSVTYAYQITPERAGTFEIPAVEIETLSGTEKTRPIRISATKSETGDLMFAEVEGNGEKVYVGQPIESTLKIWIKPMVDRKAGVKLSAQQMWQLMSDQTEWGGFETAVADPENGIRASKVLRADNEGVEREYYLYEIDGTTYPKTAGSLDAEDMHLVYQYPMALGQSRDPFDSLFADSGFGRSPFGRSSIARDFFGSRSPFGRSLTVTDARPIVVDPEVSDIEILSIPTMGQPADYRGAVGQYAIVTQASPTEVKAGDPITLQIGIRGTGPMELVQAPPLSVVQNLVKDFKVADESLAGVVQDGIKVFATTIRARSEDVTQIPAIPFSFFDPDLETFVTVTSDPIDIKVDAAEVLAFDSIVGSSSEKADGGDQPVATATPTFMLDNDASTAVLKSSKASTKYGLWWLAILPPALWAGAMLWSRRGGSPSAAKFRWSREVNQSQTATALSEIVQRALNNSSGHKDSTLQRSVPDQCSAELKTKLNGFF